MKNKAKIIVAGAGILGVCTAVHLQNRGFQVILMDKSGVARETSFGNAGIIETDDIIPINNPSLFAKIPSLIANSSYDLRFNWLFLMRNLSFFAQFLNHARPKNNHRISENLKLLMDNSFDAHHELMEICKITEHCQKNGWSFFYRMDKSFDESRGFIAKLSELGVDYSVLNQNDIAKKEPHLHPIYKHGIWFKSSASVDNPSLICQSYADYFVKNGGKIIIEAIDDIQVNRDKIVINHHHESDKLVVALGVWAKPILAKLGLNVPLISERGYHRHAFLAENFKVNQPFRDCDASFVMAPMNIGNIGECVRISSGVELNFIDAPANYQQINHATTRANEAIAIDKLHEDIWLGRRPTTPDSLPMMGALSRFPNIFMACGNQHLGFTTGAICGQLVAQLINQEKTTIPIDEFLPQRFGL